MSTNQAERHRLARIRALYTPTHPDGTAFTSRITDEMLNRARVVDVDKRRDYQLMNRKDRRTWIAMFQREVRRAGREARRARSVMRGVTHAAGRRADVLIVDDPVPSTEASP